LCLTVDALISGNRERDLRTGMTMPPRFGLKSLVSFAMHPHWSFNLLLHPSFELANISHRKDAVAGAMPLVDYMNTQFDRSVNWKDVEWLRARWDKPLVIKGLQSTDDARRAVDVGADAIMISNHGGRQLESAPAPIDCVAPIRDAVGNALELIVDGGVRRGVHVLKALALGATACSIGRAYLFGLAAGGEAGVERALSLLRDEVERSLALLGCTSLAELSPAHIVRLAGSRPAV
jgi:L-lactate dehydrogenase (cytochrome)